MRLRGGALRELQGAIAFDPVALYAGARIEPGLRLFAIGLQDDRGGIPGGGIGIDVDVVLVQRPEIPESRGGRAEGRQFCFRSKLGVRRDMVGQLHVVAKPLPIVLDDGHVVDAVVLQFQKMLRIAGVGALHVPPEVEHDQRGQHLPVRRGGMGNIRQHLVHVSGDRDAAGFLERIPLAGGGGGVDRLVLGRLRRVRPRPVEKPQREDLLAG